MSAMRDSYAGASAQCIYTERRINSVAMAIKHLVATAYIGVTRDQSPIIAAAAEFRPDDSKARRCFHETSVVSEAAVFM